jgi:hypothetical protein
MEERTLVTAGYDFYLKIIISRAWCYMPVIVATWEAKARGLQVQGQA